MALAQMKAANQHVLSSIMSSHNTAQWATLYLSLQVIHWMGRAQTAESTVAAQQQQLGVSTPRPRRDLGLVYDLVEPQQQQLIEQALVGGESWHRCCMCLYVMEPRCG